MKNTSPCIPESNVGFIIILSMERSDGRVVALGFNPKSKEFVTWLYDHEGGFNYGHYTGDLQSALNDFDRRVADV